MGKERRKSSDGYIGKNRGLDLNMHYIVGKAKVVKKNGRLEIKRREISIPTFRDFFLILENMNFFSSIQYFKINCTYSNQSCPKKIKRFFLSRNESS